MGKQWYHVKPILALGGRHAVTTNDAARAVGRARGSDFAGHAATGRMTLAIHQNTSAGAGYRKSLEGWARAGIKNVEITARLLDDFLKTDSLAAARRVLTDIGLTPVSCACGVNGPVGAKPEPRGSARQPEETLRDVRDARVCKRFYAPVTATAKFTRGRLQDRRGEHAQSGRRREAVRHDRRWRSSRARRRSSPRSARCCKMTHADGASEHAHAVRLLSLLVRPE